MTVTELVATVGNGTTLGIVLVAILTFVQIAPIKVNPWTKIARWIGKSINGEILEMVEDIDREVKDLRKDSDERNATLMRTHILHFNDEILHQKEHTKEHFDQILDDITVYEQYCEAHPSYENNKAVCAIKNIKDTYTKCMQRHSFL